MPKWTRFNILAELRRRLSDIEPRIVHRRDFWGRRYKSLVKLNASWEHDEQDFAFYSALVKELDAKF